MAFSTQKLCLLLEDEQIVIHIFNRVFANQSYALLDVATTVKEALAKINFMVYDYLYLDMNIDGVRYAGMEVLRELGRLKIKQRAAGDQSLDSRVIIMSGSVPMDEIWTEANALGAFLFLNKPVNFTEEYILRIAQQWGLPLLPRKSAET